MALHITRGTEIGDKGMWVRYIGPTHPDGRLPTHTEGLLTYTGGTYRILWDTEGRSCPYTTHHQTDSLDRIASICEPVVGGRSDG